jgi:hypothetical protein
LTRSERSLPTEHLRDRPGDDAVEVSLDPVEVIARELVPQTRPPANQPVGLSVDGGFQNNIVAKTSAGAVKRPTFRVDSSLG